MCNNNNILLLGSLLTNGGRLWLLSERKFLNIDVLHLRSLWLLERPLDDLVLVLNNELLVRVLLIRLLLDNHRLLDDDLLLWGCLTTWERFPFKQQCSSLCRIMVDINPAVQHQTSS